MIVGGYEMHLYCDFEGCKAGEANAFPARAEFAGGRVGECRHVARKAGWQIKGDKAFCPYHSTRRKRTK